MSHLSSELMTIQELHSATLMIPPEVLKLTENNSYTAKPAKPSKLSLGSKPSSSSVPDPPQATYPMTSGPNINLHYMSINTLLEILNEEELPPKLSRPICSTWLSYGQ